MSKLIQGSNQAIKTNELLIRLDEELKIVKQKHEDCLEAIPRTEMLIHNIKDDIRMLEEALVVEEGPLMKRVLQRRNYRCISLMKKMVLTMFQFVKDQTATSMTSRQASFIMYSYVTNKAVVLQQSLPCFCMAIEYTRAQ